MSSKRARIEPRIIPSGDCGNSPKNALLQDVTIALAKRDVDFLLSHVTDDVIWEVVGSDVVEGKAAFARAVDARTASDVTQLTIDHVMSHGRVGAVNGTAEYRDAKSSDFCGVFEFANAKGERVRAIRSYVIERKSVG